MRTLAGEEASRRHPGVALATASSRLRTATMAKPSQAGTHDKCLRGTKTPHSFFLALRLPTHNRAIRTKGSLLAIGLSWVPSFDGMTALQASRARYTSRVLTLDWIGIALPRMSYARCLDYNRDYPTLKNLTSVSPQTHLSSSVNPGGRVNAVPARSSRIQTAFDVSQEPSRRPLRAFSPSPLP